MQSQKFNGNVPLLTLFIVGCSSSGCGSGSDGQQIPYASGNNGSTTAAGSQVTGTTAGGPTSSTGSAGASASAGSDAGSGTTAASTNAGTTGTLGVGGATAGGATTTAASDGTTGGPASCSEAAAPYAVTSIPLATSTAPSGNTLTVSPSQDGAVYVGFNSDTGALVASNTGFELSVPDATLGGLAATNDGVGLLLFGEMWAQVQRFDAAGQQSFSTDLFRSPNLEDEGTKGEASSGRLGYMSGSDTLVAYFGHTQRYDDGVRHQGGYLATISNTGSQELLNGWFGSHNLDQRLWTSDSAGAVIGLGDAYPIGIFYSPLEENPRPEVIYRLAAAGNGAANGQLGGIVELESELIMPFITNLSVSPDIDAGEWPNIDDAIADRIREAAANGTDMGLLRVPKTGELGEGDAPTVWLVPELSQGARLVRLKSARYGNGEMILLLWAEATGGNRDASLTYYTMVVDPAGAVCQPKTPLGSGHAVSAGGDMVRAPSGAIYWANSEGGAANLVSLTPQ